MVVSAHYKSLLLLLLLLSLLWNTKKYVYVLKVIWGVGKGSEIFRENSHLV